MAIIPKRDTTDNPEAIITVTLTKRTVPILANLCKDLEEPTGTSRERTKATNYVVNKLLELAENDREYKANRAKESDASAAGKPRRVRQSDASESAA